MFEISFCKMSIYISNNNFSFLCTEKYKYDSMYVHMYVCIYVHSTYAQNMDVHTYIMYVQYIILCPNIRKKTSRAHMTVYGVHSQSVV